MRNSLKLCLAGFGAAIITASGTATVSAMTNDAPSGPPPGVATDGSKDGSQRPDWLGVADNKGNLAGYVKRDDLDALPRAMPNKDGKVKPKKLKAVKVFKEKGGKNHVGWFQANRGFIPGTTEPAPIDPQEDVTSN